MKNLLLIDKNINIDEYLILSKSISDNTILSVFDDTTIINIINIKVLRF
mgnify:CR=1 FL=1